MNPRAGVLFAAGALLAGTVTALPASASPAPQTPTTTPADDPTTRPAAPVIWKSCGSTRYPRLECGMLKVPLDHADPKSRTISLALSRVPHTAKTSQGPLLVNPGGPGGSGLGMAGFVAASLPPKLAAQYDVIGFDPRGVGRSEPALNCRPGHFEPVRHASVPLDAATESAALERARGFAEACGTKYGALLRHIDTVSAAQDLDAIRRALGAERVNYFGYSYGTYLGAVYARLYPERVRRFVLDSMVDPKGVWYRGNLAQDFAFDTRHKAFMAWVAEHDAAYGLGTDPAAVEAAWYRMRDELRSVPAGDKVGPAELEDTYLPGGYYNGYWPQLAEAFAAYVNEKDTAPLIGAYEDLGASDASDDNGYSVYASVQCRDAAWPRDWRVWRADNWLAHAKAPFSTWNNAWYNAPCAFWPVEPRTPVDVTNAEVPPMLLFQATDDAATPYEGGVSLHRAVGGSRLVVEEGGGNHAVTLGGNTCLDAHLVRYLESGTVPRAAEGSGEADAVCPALPGPQPAPAKKAAKSRAVPAPAPATGGAALHRLLGHRH
ncbi:alpha/beta hydrolase [Streptomyces sp. HUAS MG47]|uniref:alpha/beta hydrolase n=1 Tax=Streptomyces solicamelliae TaxID=3231716 RepID=UPI0038783A41